MCSGSDFIEKHGTVRRCRIPVSDSADSDASTPTGDAHAGPATTSASAQRHVVKVSVSDISTTPELPPLSFRILQLASPEYMWDLEPVLDTLRRMRKLLPTTVGMATSLCAMPETSPLAWAGRHRRPCLIATFSPADRFPIVLLEVDHSGLTSLSALSLHARKKPPPDKLEEYIGNVLYSLESGGHWPHELELVGGEDFTVRRIKRMLRHPRRVYSPEYQTSWAAMLIEKIGLG